MTEVIHSSLAFLLKITKHTSIEVISTSAGQAHVRPECFLLGSGSFTIMNWPPSESSIANFCQPCLAEVSITMLTLEGLIPTQAYLYYSLASRIDRLCAKSQSAIFGDIVQEEIEQKDLVYKLEKIAIFSTFEPWLQHAKALTAKALLSLKTDAKDKAKAYMLNWAAKQVLCMQPPVEHWPLSLQYLSAELDTNRAVHPIVGTIVSKWSSASADTMPLNSTAYAEETVHSIRHKLSRMPIDSRQAISMLDAANEELLGDVKAAFLVLQDSLNSLIAMPVLGAVVFRHCPLDLRMRNVAQAFTAKPSWPTAFMAPGPVYLWASLQKTKDIVQAVEVEDFYTEQVLETALAIWDPDGAPFSDCAKASVKLLQ